MKSVKIETLFGIVLIGILGSYGRLLSRNLGTLSQQKKAIADANQRLAFSSQSGIDVSGRLVSPLFPPRMRHAMVFVLRGASIREDLDFWRTVEILLPRDAKIVLIGYCNGDDCVNAVKRDGRLPKFPIIAYGETAGSQALLNADTQGSFLFLEHDSYKLNPIRWRDQGQTPQNIAHEVLR